MPRRTPAPAATLSLLVLALAACGPPQVTSGLAEEDDLTGTLRVWLFDEADRGPKEEVVNRAVAEFEAQYEDVEVDVSYLQVDARSERFTGAFNDPASAPDVAEFGNTDLAAYVEANGFADLTEALATWPEAQDLLPSVLDTATVDGRVYGLPWYTGARALYYRTDVFDELGLAPPRTLTELRDTARRIRAARPELYGIAVGGNYHYALMPFLWAAGGGLAEQRDGTWRATVDSPESRAGVDLFSSLLAPDICPPEQCAMLTGTQSVQVFASGAAAMTIGGDFNRAAVDAGEAAGRYAVVPLPGTEPGTIAPAFAGGNLLGVLGSSRRSTLAREFVQLLGGKEYQREMYAAMGNLPTFADLQRDLADEDPAVRPFVETLRAGTRFVPPTPAWARIDAQAVLPTMVQRVATGESVDSATADAADAMNVAFGS
ncbi:extracellular solute-binding protein [Actinoalloteichus caeruleus]|uniref:N,N'-diacetylchitobiose transport system substrate-binding protein n=1 Tax=Actinoalloteichus caeruleus DSM 43889 TaxID=1120930 RepID=A0ABT1JD15_ACTCY|nr:extracellular solute-binding protein [Actinoalloteichus caeruleus]MCP2330387.1 N,N'-diacetylchitobiose transport system substrate-binding protein [Actinoalloteichus caeruleus DSM 43889]